MSDTINGRTPDEIKKGLECCVVKLTCEGCPYSVGNPSCLGKMRKDLLALINQLQEDKKQLERERDAAANAMKELAARINSGEDVAACERRTGGGVMKKTVCPKCGGTLILENLCQYGERQVVCKNGKLRKKVKKVDHGSMDFQYLFCGDCKYCFKESEFDFYGDRVELIEVE